MEGDKPFGYLQSMVEFSLGVLKTICDTQKDGATHSILGRSTCGPQINCVCMGIWQANNFLVYFCIYLFIYLFVTIFFSLFINNDDRNWKLLKCQDIALLS